MNMKELDIYSDYLSNASICLLGCGPSLEYNLSHISDTDIVIGINRIYQTKLIDRLNILYHNGAGKGCSLKNTLITKSPHQLKHIVYIPSIDYTDTVIVEKHRSRFVYNKIDGYNFINHLDFAYKEKNKYGVNLLTGISTLSHIIYYSKNSYRQIKILGFDFYRNAAHTYCYGLQQFKQTHDTESNKKVFDEIVNQNDKIIIY